MIRLYAQPYDISAVGFYFESAEEYLEKVAKAKNSYGAPVEEFEIQFIDGEAIDAKLFEALGVNQCNFAALLQAAEKWDEHEKRKAIIAVGECGYTFDPAHEDPDEFEIEIHEIDSLRDLAIQFVDDGLFGDIPERIQSYLDYDAIARDLGIEYTQTQIAGIRLLYRAS